MVLRRVLAVLALTSGLAALPATARAGPRSDAELARIINAERRAHGLRPLTLSPTLSRLARNHSRAMAARDRLWHNDISHSSNHWVWLGQNVGLGALGDGGLGPSVRRLNAAFMASPPHQANILKRGANRFGVGTFISRGQIWTTINLEQTTPGWP
jgi:uncharacterized protein YkwD